MITEYGKQNIFARETPPQLVENCTIYPKEAEKNNERWAMIGMISLLGAYVAAGQIIPESYSKSINYINVVNEFSTKTAELSNGRWAMIGITSLIGAYATTVQIMPVFF